MPLVKSAAVKKSAVKRKKPTLKERIDRILRGVTSSIKQFRL